MMRVCGIDPGQKGSLCIMTLHDTGIKEVVFEAMPLIGTEIDGHRLAQIFGSLVDCTVYIEKLNAFQMGASSAFNFGRGCGLLLGIIYSHKIPFVEVTPMIWQKEMHQGIDRKSMPDPKQRSLAAARKLFPHIELRKKLETKMLKFPDSGYVDALLIAEFGMRSTATRHKMGTS